MSVRPYTEEGENSVLDIRVDSIDFDTIRITDENGETTTYNVNAELQVHEFNVRQAFLEQPAKYAFWSAVLEKLKMYQETYELQLSTKRAELYDSSRLLLVERGIQKPTKDQIEAEIALDSEYQKVANNVIVMNYNVRRLTAFVKAVEQRKDMLIQYGADLRRENEYSKKITMPNAPQNPNYTQPLSQPNYTQP